jgi:hypothetical protein
VFFFSLSLYCVVDFALNYSAVAHAVADKPLQTDRSASCSCSCICAFDGALTNSSLGVFSLTFRPVRKQGPTSEATVSEKKQGYLRHFSLSFSSSFFFFLFIIFSLFFFPARITQKERDHKCTHQIAPVTKTETVMKVPELLEIPRKRKGHLAQMR